MHASVGGRADIAAVGDDEPSQTHTGAQQ